MTYVRCPYCHCSAPAPDYLQCDDQAHQHFALCPECDACIPLPATEHYNAPLELAADQLAGARP